MSGLIKSKKTNFSFFILGIFLLVFTFCQNQPKILTKTYMEGDDIIVDSVFIEQDSLIQRVYDINRMPKAVYHFKNDSLSGVKLKYYPNHQLEYIARYYRGKRHGLSKLYYPNGNLHAEERYFEQKLQGTLTKYDSLANLIRTSYFQKDKMVYLKENNLEKACPYIEAADTVRVAARTKVTFYFLPNDTLQQFIVKAGLEEIWEKDIIVDPIKFDEHGIKKSYFTIYEPGEYVISGYVADTSKDSLQVCKFEKKIVAVEIDNI